jgi:hypothetical protein
MTAAVNAMNGILNGAEVWWHCTLFNVLDS